MKFRFSPVLATEINDPLLYVFNDGIKFEYLKEIIFAFCRNKKIEYFHDKITFIDTDRDHNFVNSTVDNEFRFVIAITNTDGYLCAIGESDSNPFGSQVLLDAEEIVKEEKQKDKLEQFRKHLCGFRESADYVCIDAGKYLPEKIFVEFLQTMHKEINYIGVSKWQLSNLLLEFLKRFL